MIAFAQDRHDTNVAFIDMLPRIRRRARAAFRSATPEAQEELVAEVVANAFVAYSRLVALGKSDLAYATPLASYAIRQVCDGRRVGSQRNIRDITYGYAQRAKEIMIERLDARDGQTGEWQEVLVEDRHAGPAETAAARLDVAMWFCRLPPRNRKIARDLAKGETTKDVAKRFRVTAGRVSQLRREMEASWQKFQGETMVGL